MISSKRYIFYYEESMAGRIDRQIECGLGLKIKWGQRYQAKLYLKLSPIKKNQWRYDPNGDTICWDRIPPAANRSKIEADRVDA